MSIDCQQYLQLLMATASVCSEPIERRVMKAQMLSQQLMEQAVAIMQNVAQGVGDLREAQRDDQNILTYK